MATLVDCTKTTKYDTYLGRARKRNVTDPRQRTTHRFSSPYFKYTDDDGREFRDRARDDYNAYLRTKLQDPRELELFMQLKDDVIGVWGDFGMYISDVVLDLLSEADEMGYVEPL